MSSGEGLVAEASSLLAGIKGVGVNREKKDKLLAILSQLRKETDDVEIQNEKLKCEAEKVGDSNSFLRYNNVFPVMIQDSNYCQLTFCPLKTSTVGS